MTTHLHTLEGVVRKNLDDLCRGVFLDGNCYAFATALHEGLGWPMVGLMSGDTIRHVVVVSPEGDYYDARGKVSPTRLGIPFGMMQGGYELRNVTIDELERPNETPSVRQSSIRMARKFAEALWPELPWRDSAAQRAAAFCDELEALSRKHGIWIRATVPGARPILYTAYGDETGYELHTTEDGLAFTMDRTL